MTNRLQPFDYSASKTGLCTVKVGHQIFEFAAELLLAEPYNVLQFVVPKNGFGVPKHGFGICAEFTANPNIFSLIRSHLLGYEILPLHPGGLPFGDPDATPGFQALSNMSVEVILKSLYRDAKDLGFDRLAGKVKAEMERLNVSNDTLGPDIGRKKPGKVKEYRLAINNGGWAHWTSDTTQGTSISEGAKEAILLKLVNSDITLVTTSMPIPKGFRCLAAWHEFQSSGTRDRNTKSFVLLESI